MKILMRKPMKQYRVNAFNRFALKNLPVLNKNAKKLNGI